MPKKDGIEATKNIRESGSSAHIIGLTANTDDYTRDFAILSGMDNFLLKPVRIADLKHAFEKAIHSR
jgi:CheY-like chemotaxis protein